MSLLEYFARFNAGRAEVGPIETRGDLTGLFFLLSVASKKLAPNLVNLVLILGWMVREPKFIQCFARRIEATHFRPVQHVAHLRLLPRPRSLGRKSSPQVQPFSYLQYLWSPIEHSRALESMRSSAHCKQGDGRVFGHCRRCRARTHRQANEASSWSRHLRLGARLSHLVPAPQPSVSRD